MPREKKAAIRIRLRFVILVNPVKSPQNYVKLTYWTFSCLLFEKLMQ
jgi:hypothetical protein